MTNKIAIHSVPRSGSTWLGSIFNSCPQVIYKYQPLFSYAMKGFLNQNSSAQDIHDFFQKLSTMEDDFMDQLADKEKGNVPNFEKNNADVVVYKEVRYHHILHNMLKNDSDVKVIGLVRNPMATISSWLNAPREFRADEGWKVDDEWRWAPKKNQNKIEEFNGFEKWKEVALLFEKLSKQYPQRFYLLNYDDLLNNTLQQVQSLFDFAGIVMTPQTEDFLKKSRSVSVNDAYGVYKKKTADDQWKNKLPESIVETIKTDLKDSILQKYL